MRGSDTFMKRAAPEGDRAGFTDFCALSWPDTTPVGLPLITLSLNAFALNRFNLANVRAQRAETKRRGQLYSV